MNKDKISQMITAIGMLLIAIGIVAPMAMVMGECSFASFWGIAYKVVYALGALMVVAGRVMWRYKGDNSRLKRLYRIEAWSAIFFCVAAFFMWYPPSPYPNFPANLRDVLAFTIAGAAIQIYASIMIWIQLNKTEKK